MQIFVRNDGERKSFYIVEIQGDLESRIGDSSMTGKFIGDLHFSKDSGAPILIIGHHILYGKVVNLDKPFVIAKKIRGGRRDNSDQMEDNMDVDMEDNDQTRGSTEFTTRGIVRQKLLFKTRPKPIIANVPKKI